MHFNKLFHNLKNSEFLRERLHAKLLAKFSVNNIINLSHFCDHKTLNNRCTKEKKIFNCLKNNFVINTKNYIVYESKIKKKTKKEIIYLI